MPKKSSESELKQQKRLSKGQAQQYTAPLIYSPYDKSEASQEEKFRDCSPLSTKQFN